MKKKLFSVLAVSLAVLCVFFVSTGQRMESIRNTISDAATGLIVGQQVEVDSISTDKYAYRQLSDSGQTIYDQLLNAILNMDDSVVIGDISEDDLSTVFYSILADYGGLFWVTGYQFHNYSNESLLNGGIVYPTYSMSKSERDEYQAQVDAVVEQWMADLPADASDYDKSLYVYRLLAENVTYDQSNDNNQNILSVFLDGRSVCQGYADAMSYLLNQAGVESTVVRGTANGESHAWNLLCLDGSYYFTDPTWGSSLSLTGDSSGVAGIQYAYLNVTGEELLRTHTPEGLFPLPDLTATADNYYVKSGLYFSSGSTGALADAIREAYDAGSGSISVKFSDEQVCASMIDYLFEDNAISKILPGVHTLHYSRCEDMNVLMICFS